MVNSAYSIITFLKTTPWKYIHNTTIDMYKKVQNRAIHKSPNSERFKCLPIVEWGNTFMYIYSMKYYTAMKMNITTYNNMNLIDIILSKKNS